MIQGSVSRDLTKIPYVGGCSEAPFEGGATGRPDQKGKVAYGRQPTVQACPAPVLVLLSGFVRVSYNYDPRWVVVWVALYFHCWCWFQCDMVPNA